MLGGIGVGLCINFLQIKIPPEMEVTPRYELLDACTLFSLLKLFRLFTLFTLFTLLTRFTLFTLLILLILFKLLSNA